MTARILDGKALAQRLRDELKLAVEHFQKRSNVVPHLVAVLVGDDPASQVYVRNKEAACAKAGMQATVMRLPDSTTQGELLSEIHRLNTDPAVHGILVQLPLPVTISAERVLDAVTPLKDVDCFHAENVGLMVQGRPRFLPCTPCGVQQLLIRSEIKTAGKHVVILGRSDIVGKPLANMFIQKGAGADATVTVCHSKTANLPEITRSADILVAAIGKAEFVTADHVRPGVVVIDVGINRVGDKLVGDVAFAPVSEVASAITPVPGGVGPMTIAMLLQNTLRAAELLS